MLKLVLMFMGTLVVFAGGCSSIPALRTDSGVAATSPQIAEMSPADAQPMTAKAYSQFVDVRTPEEYAQGHAARAINIPLDTLSSSLDKLEKNEPVYLICQTGNRSGEAAVILNEKGFAQVVNIIGGTTAWQAAQLPMEARPPHTTDGKLDERTRSALIMALGDERRAEATYRAILNRYPGARPFVNVIEAEKHHQVLLLGLFTKYDLAVPANDFDPTKIAVPESLAGACKEGVTAENENIALYDGFFQFVAEPDIRDVFTKLQNASRKNHLPAFGRCSESGMGRGRANR